MKAQLHPRHELPARHIEEMFRLFTRHFSGVTIERFVIDLGTKNWVLLMQDDTGRLAGFSTLDFQVTEFGGRSESVLYSGDTIMDPGAWNSTILSRAWIEAAYNLHHRFGRGPLWWLLITSGFRTYRLLPVFWRDFFPRWDAEPPPQISERLNAFARDRFASCFDPHSGIVHFEHPQRLREHLHGVPSHRLRNRHVAFFTQRNPGHLNGDELVCLTRLEDANLTSAGQRIVASIRRDPVLAEPVS